MTVEEKQIILNAYKEAEELRSKFYKIDKKSKVYIQALASVKTIQDLMQKLGIGEQ